MKRIFLINFIVVSFYLNGQDILKDSELKPGLYESYYSFRTNNPDLPGKIDFIENDNGKVLKINLDGDSIRLNKVIKQYWGFCKDGVVYVNVAKQWSKLGLSTTPKTPYYPLQNFGYYCYFDVEITNASSMIVMGSLIGGAVGGVIAGAIASTLPGDFVTLYFGHNDGVIKVTNKESFEFALIDEPDLRKDYKNEEKITDEVFKNYLDKFNKIKKEKGDLNFSNYDYLPVISIIKDPKIRSEKPIEILLNEEIIGVLDETNKQIRVRIQFDTINVIQVRIEEGFADELEVKLQRRERKYFMISGSKNQSGLLLVKEIDSNKTLYILQTSK